MNGVREKLEKSLGLPKLENVLDLVKGKSGERLERILDKLDKLNPNVKEGRELLLLVKELNDMGALERFDRVLGKLVKLAKTGIAKELIEKVKEE